VPTHPINKEYGLRAAVAINDKKYQLLHFNAPSGTKQWSDNVLRGYSSASSDVFVLNNDGKVIVKLALLDPGLAVTKIVVTQKAMSIGLIGDSTVATTYGWGPAFAKEVNKNVTILNYAKNGATLDSLSKRLNELIKQKPDFILIQFGHNDMKRYDTRAYSKKLRDYAVRVRSAGIMPIIVSSVTRRNFDEHGKIAPRVIHGRSLPDYARAAEAVAKEMNLPFIDLNSISIKHHNQIGPKASARYNFHKTDTTHFSKAGAQAIADLLINALKSKVPLLTPCFK